MGIPKKQAMKEKTIVISVILLSLIFLSTLAIAIPTGPSAITHVSNTTGIATGGQMVNISGGYISKFNITATSQNPHWKAFVGQLEGKFTLDDSTGSTIYDWTMSTVTGEVYATRASATIEWTTIGCANAAQITAEDVAMEQTGEDNITSTFTPASNAETFLVAGTTITTNTCSATNTYVNNVTDTKFEEVILYDSTNTDIVFATVLEADEQGYDGATYDFQMIVPENGNETNTGTTAYYIYVELG
ncbi:hypothetical protein K8R30_02730 [archaeon]|nr:hypothetical protein [archaeon]